MSKGLTVFLTSGKNVFVPCEDDTEVLEAAADIEEAMDEGTAFRFIDEDRIHIVNGRHIERVLEKKTKEEQE